MSNIKQVIVMRKDLEMRKGKMIAQGSHASMKFLTNKIQNGKFNGTLNKTTIEWLESGTTKICCYVESEEELTTLVHSAQIKGIPVNTIIDAGKTEFNGVPTLTCAAFGPWISEEIDKVTGHLKLL